MSRNERHHHLLGVAAHRCIAGRSSRCHRLSCSRSSFRVQVSMTASDQHQPASSLAMAMFAIVGRLRRSRNRTHRS